MRKFLFVLACTAAVMLCGCSAQTAASDETETKTIVDEYEENPYEFRSLGLEYFSDNAEDAPSDEELTRMLNFAQTSANGHGQTPAHFIVIRDPEEQYELLKGIEGFGLTVPASEGTVTILICSDNLRTQDVHEARYTNWYSNGLTGIYDTGAATAYLSIAAEQLGYSVHQLAGLNLVLEDTGEFSLGNAFRYDLIQGRFWDGSKYMISADGEVAFTHSVGSYESEGDQETIQAKDNLTVLAAIVIGKRVDTVDAESAATTVITSEQANYNFWDPQDGTSYGNSIPVSELDTSAESDVAAEAETDITSLPDGTYTGTGKSTSSEYTVTAEVKDGRIVSVAVTEGIENMFGGEDKVNEFCQEIVDAQSIEIDAVSGATQDCEGITSALKEAFSK